MAKLDAEAIGPDALDAVRGMSQQGELAIKVESFEEASGRMLANADGFSLQAARHLHERVSGTDIRVTGDLVLHLEKAHIPRLLAGTA